MDATRLRTVQESGSEGRIGRTVLVVFLKGVYSATFLRRTSTAFQRLWLKVHGFLIKGVVYGNGDR